MLRRPEVSLLSSTEDLHALEPEWDELAELCAAQPFGQPAVALSWWEHLGKGTPLVVTVRRDGRLVGLAPLHERRVGGARVLRFLGHGMGAVGELLVRDTGAGPGTGEEIATAVWDELGGGPWRALQLLGYRHGGRGLEELRRSPAWRSRLVIRDRCPVIDLHDVADAGALLARPGRRKLRQNMARADRFAVGAGRRLVLDVYTEEAELSAVLEELRLVHDRAETANPRQHFLAGPNRLFTEAVLMATAARGRAAVVVARLDDEVIGFHVCLRSGSTAWAWLARVDPAAAEWAPGHLMIRAVIDWCIADGATRLDLQLGDDLYKRRWSTGGYDTVHVVAAPPGWLTPAAGVLDGVERVHSLRQPGAVPAIVRPSVRRAAERLSPGANPPPLRT